MGNGGKLEEKKAAAKKEKSSDTIIKDKPDDITDVEHLQEQLYKKAVGYIYKEIVKEYAANKDNKLVLVKKKVTEKEAPPDVSAAKVIFEQSPAFDDEIDTLNPEELEKLRLKLINDLKGQKVEKNKPKQKKEEKYEKDATT